MIFSFNTILLSSGNTGFPNSITTTLSANGVRIVGLNGNHSGLSFNKNTTLNGNLVLISIESSKFLIDSIYQSAPFALIKNNSTHVTFYANTANELQSDYIDGAYISTPETRRKLYLGYNAGSRYLRDNSTVPIGFISVKQPNSQDVLQPNGLNIFAPLKL